MKSIKILALALIATITFSSCSDDSTPPKPVVEEEVITTMTITLKNGNETVTLKSYDADGEGSNPPVLTVSGDLKQSTTYTGNITLLNEMEKPAENITEEVKTEGKAHQFFYSSNKGLATFAYTDKDADENPIGLTFTLTTAGTGSDKLTFVLRHTPNKTASGVKEGNIANAGGSTDAEATFDVVIK